MRHPLFLWLAFGLAGWGIALDSPIEAAEVWKDMNNQVLQLYQMGRHEKAIPVAEQALKKAESEFGAESPETALSLNNLALLYKTEGKYDEAIRLYERSLAIAEKIAGPRHEDLLVPLNNLAMLYESQGEKEKAEKVYERIRNMGQPGTAEVIKKRARQ